MALTLTNPHPTPTLYHGTSLANARRLLAHGWAPNTLPSGHNQGRTDRLYATTTPDNAAWYADRHDQGVVLRIDLSDGTPLHLDPEDSSGATVAEELALPHGLPGNLTIATPLPASAFTSHPPQDAP